MANIKPGVIINVTAHAIERWRQRFPAEKCHVDTVADHIKRGKLLGKGEFLPIPRTSDCVYIYAEDVKAFFILKNAGLKKLELLTMYKWEGVGALQDIPTRIPDKPPTKDDLKKEQMFLEASLSAMTRNDARRPEVVDRVNEIKAILTEYKNSTMPGDPLNPALIDKHACSILIELREIKRLLAGFAKLLADKESPNECADEGPPKLQVHNR